MLPRALLEVIFQKIDDPVTLTKLKLVCKLWKDILENTLINHPQWRVFCDSKVPSFWKKFPGNPINQVPDDEYDENDMWRKIYISWMDFQKRIELPKSVDSSRVEDLLKCSEFERITCITVQFDVLAFATTAGVIYFSHFQDIKRPFFIADHGRAVTEVQLCWEYDGDTVVKNFFSISTNEDGNIAYWDIGRRIKFGPTGNFGRFLDATAGERASCISIWDGCLSCCTFQNDFADRSWEYQLLRLDTTRKIVASEMEPLPKILVLDNVNSCTELYQWEGISKRPLRCTDVNRRIKRCLPKDFAESQFKKFILITDGNVIAACLTDSWMALSIDDGPWVSHNMYDFLGGNVRSLNQFDTLSRLFLGLDTGELVMYFDGNWNRTWNNFDFAQTAPVKLTFDSEPIVHVEFNYSQQCIIAVTEKNIYSRKFDIHADAEFYGDIADDDYEEQ